MKYVAVIVQRQLSGGVALGVSLFRHRHGVSDGTEPKHFHVVIDLLWWFVEFRVGRDS